MDHQWSDGLSKLFRLAVRLFKTTDVSGAAPDADPDGDGAINQLEYLTGSNPLLRGDGWTISILPKVSSVEIGFPRLANRAFEVQWNTNLFNGRSWVSLDIPTTVHFLRQRIVI
jgi:hypothetical protein